MDLETSANIKYLKALLCEAVEYIQQERRLRWTHEIENPRLDAECSELLKEIKAQYTPKEWEDARESILQKYEQP
jgi:hypothetical protein